jgi:hypothetical protein
MLTHVDDDGDQRILLADFGIARNVDDISGLTTTNMTVGRTVGNPRGGQGTSRMLKRGDRTAAIGPIVGAVAGRAMVAGEPWSWASSC